MSIVIAIIVFGIIILVHELGHFFAARKVGILVEEFAIGMGPKIFSIKRGETVYSLRIFPLGGFCKMLGEDENNTDTRAFNNKTIGQRTFALSAGVMMNILLAFVIFSCLALFFGYSNPKVTGFVSNTAAEVSGIMQGDTITKIGKTRVNIIDDLTVALNENGDKPIDIEVKRGKEFLTTTVTPTFYEGRYMIGVTLEGYGGIIKNKTSDGQTIENQTPMGPIWGYLINGFWQILFWIKLTVVGVIRLITFNISANEIGGPIMIVSVMNEAYTATIAESVTAAVRTMAAYMGIISANLGVMNLLPLPALDGGRIVFLIIEKIRRKPVPPEREGLIHFIGFVALICLAVFIAFKDIKSLL